MLLFDENLYNLQQKTAISVLNLPMLKSTVILVSKLNLLMEENERKQTQLTTQIENLIIGKA